MTLRLNVHEICKSSSCYTHFKGTSSSRLFKKIQRQQIIRMIRLCLGFYQCFQDDERTRELFVSLLSDERVYFKAVVPKSFSNNHMTAAVSYNSCFKCLDHMLSIRGLIITSCSISSCSKSWSCRFSVGLPDRTDTLIGQSLQLITNARRLLPQHVIMASALTGLRLCMWYTTGPCRFLYFPKVLQGLLGSKIQVSELKEALLKDPTCRQRRA